MTSKDALKFIRAQADELGWERLAAEMGLHMGLVYGWWRRGNVPEWRIQTVEAFAKKTSKRKVA